jgi:hypothetical protein
MMLEILAERIKYASKVPKNVCFVIPLVEILGCVIPNLESNVTNDCQELGSYTKIY